MSSPTRTIARKELRAQFLSPVALMFLAIFLIVQLVGFYTYSKFFTRNLADARPLFAGLPIFLIFLVSALTMRAWSEEQKMGTLEILMTLPARTRDLVLGKFWAGMALVGLALLLTLPVPITVDLLGNLDWGPVFGGYVAAFLLASTYMAVGLCVSSRTDNQIVALMVTGLLCSALYAVGSPTVTSWFGHTGAELLRALGTGSRFDSIERGVLDLRDLFYYGSLTTFFLVLNGHFIELKRMEQNPPTARRRALQLTVLLAGLNVLAGNLWLAPVTSIRADLTADGDYSISEATEQILADLDEPLIIRGYFSEKTAPELAPLVPRLRDFLTEYEVRGAGQVTVQFVDPTTDPELEDEIAEQFGIKSRPFETHGTHERGVVNSYFHVLIKQGDQFEVLGVESLVDVHFDEATGATIKLRNIEYDITRSIKKVTQGFQTLEAVLARSTEPVKLTAYLSPKSLPEEFKNAPALIKKAAEALVAQSGGKFSYTQIDPTGNRTLQDELIRKYNFQALSADLFGEQTFYLHLVVEAGDHVERIFPQGELTAAVFRSNIESAIKRVTPGFLKTIGLFTAAEERPDMMARGMGKRPKRADFHMLEGMLSTEFNVRRTQLEDGVVPGDIDVLIVGKTGTMTPKQQFAIDQYLMRGGALIVYAGGYSIEPGRTELGTKRTDDKLLDLLQKYGVKVSQSFVLDTQNLRRPVPAKNDRGEFEVRFVPYPYFVDVRQDGYGVGHVAVAGVPNVVLAWPSPLTIEAVPKGAKAEVFLETTAEAWLSPSTRLEPDFETYPQLGWAPPKDATIGKQALAVSVTGTFESYFADKDSPLFQGEGKPGESTNALRNAQGRTMKQSSPDARLVVIGSAESVADLVSSLIQQPGGEVLRGNVFFARNLVDWALADTDLLQIRSAGAFARTLRPLKAGEAFTYEIANYIVVLLALLAVLIAAATRRRRAQPISLAGGER